MPKPCRCMLAAGVLMSILAAGALVPRTAFGQFKAIHLPDNTVRGTRANIFATWEGMDPLEGLSVDLPLGWTLDSTSLLLDGYLSVPLQIEQVEESEYRILLEEEVTGSAELVFTVFAGEGSEAGPIELTPLAHVGPMLIPQSSGRTSRSLYLGTAGFNVQNHVITFSAEDAEPVLLRRERIPDLDLRTSFSVSFWLRTHGLSEVVLSTWNGDENEPYPVEVIVDAAGRLRDFHGQPGEHQSLMSQLPVADGSWHLISIVNEPQEGWMRLQIDGITVDSLYAQAPPGISMGLSLAVGGRVPGRATYFDGLKPFSGSVDDLNISSASAGGLELDFEEAMPSELLQRPVEGVQRERSDLGVRLSVQDFRVEQNVDGVMLTWRAAGARIQGFEVERARDGREFEVIERVRPNAEREYRVFDSEARNGVAYYRIRRITPAGSEVVSSTVKVGLGAERPERAVLFGNFPNPFNASTTITYEVKENVNVELAIWDLSGQPIATLVDGRQGPGSYEVRFDADDLPSGTYFVRLRTPGQTASHKIILTK